MPDFRPLVNPQVAAHLETLGWIEDRDFLISPPLPMTGRKPRLKVYLEPRDAWIGAYVAKDAIYVCLLPFLVIRYWRKQLDHYTETGAITP
jgi:hypothetical protein